MKRLLSLGFVLSCLAVFAGDNAPSDVFLDTVAGGTISVTSDLPVALGVGNIFFSRGAFVNTPSEQWARLELATPAARELVLKAGGRQIPITAAQTSFDGSFRIVTLMLASPVMRKLVVYAEQSGSVLGSDFAKQFGNYLSLNPGPNAKPYPETIYPSEE